MRKYHFFPSIPADKLCGYVLRFDEELFVCDLETTALALATGACLQVHSDGGFIRDSLHEHRGAAAWCYTLLFVEDGELHRNVAAWKAIRLQSAISPFHAELVALSDAVATLDTIREYYKQRYRKLAK